KVLDLTDEEWASIQDIALNVFYDDGEGYIDLGIDNIFDLDDDGDLIASFDGTWLSLNRQIVPYYWIDRVDDGDAYLIRGYIPAILNRGTEGETEVQIMLQFDDQNPYGYITGARIVYDADVTGTAAKGLIALKKGDTLDFICDYYDYAGNYQAKHFFGNQFVVNGPIEIANIAMENNRSVATYQLADIYGNYFYTPSF
ncbi:MAG: peptidase C11, partial [Clostridia bacterium]|nr:peptidase C11 [Clostridia bacterium]